MNGETLELWFSGLLTYFVHSSVFLLVALAVTSAGLARRIATKELIWRTALVFGLITAPLQTLGLLNPVFEPIKVVQSNKAQTSLVAGQAPRKAPSLAPDPARVAQQAKLSGPAPRDFADTVSLGTYAWILLAMLLLGHFLVLVFKLRRQIRGREEVTDRRIVALAEALAGKLDITSPRLSIKKGLSSPFCLLGGEIVLPDWVLELSPGQQEAMLAHELAHLKRNDPAWLLLGRFIQSVAFFQPLNAVANRRLGELSEFACDSWSRRLCQSGLALAECLAECARRQSGQVPAELGMAMAGRRSPILERTRLLLDHRADEPGSAPLVTRLAVMATFAMMTLLLPAFATGENPEPGSVRTGDIEMSSSGSIAIENDGFVVLDTVQKSGDRKLSLKGKGRFRFNEAETEMVSMSPDSYLDIEEKSADSRRRVRFEENSGNIAETFWLNGSKTEKDAAMRAWLAKVIPDFYRATGLDAENRARRLHQQGGVDRVLEEIALIPGSYTRRTYASILAGLDAFTDAETDSFMKLATNHMGSYDLRETLVAYANAQDPSELEWQLFARAAAQIPSSYDLRETLTSASSKFSGSTETWQSLLEAAAQISSSYDLRETLTAFSRYMPGDGSVMAGWAATAQKISSSYDLRETVSAYARKGGFDSSGWLALMDAAEKITSSFDKREALVSIARAMPRDKALVDRYRDLAAGISGNFDREQAEQAL